MSRLRLCYAIASPDVVSMPIAWTGQTRPICEALAGFGYGAVEVQVRDPAAFDARALRDTIAACGLELAGFSTGPVTSEGLTLSSSDPATRRRAVDRLKSIADLAAECGATVALGSVRGGSATAGSLVAAADHFRAALTDLVEHTAGAVLFLVEPQSVAVTDLLTTVADALGFVADFPASSVALEVDTFHVAAQESSATQPFRDAAAAGRLAHVQLADSGRSSPGDGTYDWRGLAGTLDELGYSGWASVESLQQPSGAAAASRAAAFLRGIGEASEDD